MINKDMVLSEIRRVHRLILDALARVDAWPEFDASRYDSGICPISAETLKQIKLTALDDAIHTLEGVK